MNGAVQGVATIVARTPVKNVPGRRPERGRAARRRPASAHAKARDPSGQAQPHCEEEIREHRDKDRRLQLKAPADRLAAGAQREQRGAERCKAYKHPRRIGEPVIGPLGAMPVSVLRNAEQFQGKDWKDAGHRIEFDTAEKRQQ